jgi:protein CSF1
VGNGDLAPQYGIDIALQGGTARYGPWADRQRSVLVFHAQ